MYECEKEDVCPSLLIGIQPRPTVVTEILWLLYEKVKGKQNVLLNVPCTILTSEPLVVIVSQEDI